jgi:hypothetical protein
VKAHSTSAKYPIDKIMGIVSKDVLYVALVYDDLSICFLKTNHVTS